MDNCPYCKEDCPYRYSFEDHCLWVCPVKAHDHNELLKCVGNYLLSQTRDNLSDLLHQYTRIERKKKK